MQANLTIGREWVLAWFAGASVTAFLAFALDKWLAARAARRIPEALLAALGAAGGWLGGLAGMLVFRHKTAKWSFKLKYALAFIPFAVEVWLALS